MEKFKKLIFVCIASMLCMLSAQATAYTVTVSSPGNFEDDVNAVCSDWNDITSLTVSGTMSKADMVMFQEMPYLETLDVSGLTNDYFGGCKERYNLSKVILSSSCKKILDDAFSNCGSLSSINLENIEEIGNNSFHYCSNLTNLKLSSLITINTQGFNYCYGIKTIDAPNLERIGEWAFSGCSQLSSIDLSKVKVIESSAFSSCQQINNVDLSGCSSLGEFVFNGCSNLTTFIWSPFLTNIPYFCFAGCKISELEIPDWVTGIAEMAFENNPYLTKITLSPNCTWIGNNAFSNIGTVKEVYCPLVYPFSTEAFNTTDFEYATLYVPGLSIDMYKANSNCKRFADIQEGNFSIQDLDVWGDLTITNFRGLTANPTLNIREYSQFTVNATNSFNFGNIEINRYREETSWHWDPITNTDNYYLDHYPVDFATIITNSPITCNNIIMRFPVCTECWSFISLPYDVNFDDIKIQKETQFVIRKYDGESRAANGAGDNWVNVKSGDVLKANQGYIIHCTNFDTSYALVEFPSAQAVSLASGDVTLNLEKYEAEFSHNRGWNQVGNPYISYFSTDYIDLDAPITVWENQSYFAYSLVDDEYVLSPNESFFVQCPVNTSTMKFLAGGCSHDKNFIPRANAPRRLAAEAQTRDLFNFVLSNGDYSDRTRIVLNENAAYDYEVSCDASKFMSNNSAVPQIFVNDNGLRYAIDERPIGAGVFTLGTRIGEKGQFTLALNQKTNTEYSVILTDNVTGNVAVLSDKDYEFEAEAGTNSSRFTIEIGANTNVLGNLQATEARLCVNGKVLSVTNPACQAIAIYTVDGKCVARSSNADFTIQLSNGVYMVQIGKEVKKVIVK